MPHEPKKDDPSPQKDPRTWLAVSNLVVNFVRLIVDLIVK